ncbi:DUF2538 family protein [Paenibacillus radicis (ex Xue et al. 2023)]|uniref:DUF2538 family protein n=1 Tax=Paenibacillus radicis (ex Xue et al. 2023) TaxID=2972489 RepID=A0ABT1YRH4_9BACL|nr:DUF2538 family protein [Paenibacillus radicis (ex Xue et al. 2023)]MCR8635771.1 DUF2538 family protein [Paenibacillus radicis (ex Xue et al. 2023)]
MPNIFYTNEKHLTNFRWLLAKFGSIDSSEYTAACYILACPEIYSKVDWNKCEYPFDFISLRGNKRVELSSGYLLLVRMAQNLYNSSNNRFNLMKGLAVWDANLIAMFHTAMDLRMRRVLL